MSVERPLWIAGGRFLDERGALAFVNDFDLSTFVRFYCIKTNEQRTLRAWQGHRCEQKAFFCISGAVKIAAVKVDDWEHPSPRITPLVFDLQAEKPGILWIPGGWANGIKPISEHAELLVFSNKSVEQSQKDDIRFHPNQWNPWEN